MSHELLQTALTAARSGVETLRGLWGRHLEVKEKHRFDFVTNADQAAERAVLEIIRQNHPDHAILAEESAGDFSRAAQTPGVLWVVDPLDGTTNYIHGFPHVAVSVAALVDGRPAAGVIIDVTRQEEFAAARGLGVTLDGKPVKASPVSEPSKALLLTGFPFRQKDRLNKYLDLFAELFLQVSGMRRAGAAALDLAYVAAGRAEGFWEMGLKPWDMAAGILMVEEAGGLVSDFDGGDQALWRGDIVAANQDLHRLVQAACGRKFPNG
jgi:myo-inositol-1(or 4)-monophosphatase